MYQGHSLLRRSLKFRAAILQKPGPELRESRVYLGPGLPGGKQGGQRFGGNQ